MSTNVNKGFTINATIKSGERKILVTSAETSDGVPYYVCYDGPEEITQIRKDEEEWKQIWGKLSDEDVQSIGEAISQSAEFE